MLCIITVAASHFHKKQAGFLMPSPLQFLCHPAAAAPLNGFAERCQLPGLLNPGYSFICCSLSGPLWNKEQHIQSSQSVQTGTLLWRLPWQGVRKWHLLWHYSLVRTGAATVSSTILVKSMWLWPVTRGWSILPLPKQPLFCAND